MRFFTDRRIPVAFVDVGRKSPAPLELRRFAQRFGAPALIDTGSRAYRDAGLGYLAMSDEQIFERVIADPRLLRLPLTRMGSDVTVGLAEEAWRTWLASTGDGQP